MAEKMRFPTLRQGAIVFLNLQRGKLEGRGTR